MASELLKQFADELKSTREAKAVTLQHIANKTKIDLKFLQAIEEANFEILPELYIRAFIKEYANTIDLNFRETLQKYDIAKSGKIEEKPGAEIIQTKTETEEKEGTEKKQTEIPAQPVKAAREFNSVEAQPARNEIPEVSGRFKLKTNYIIGAGILVVALFIVYFAFLNKSSHEIIAEKSEQELDNSNNERFEIKNQPQAADQNKNLQDAPILSPDSLRLSVLTTSRVWVKVSTDGKIIQQQVVPADSRLNFAATKNFSLSIGNAGFVKVFFNNKPVENVGKPGEIRNLFITTDGIKYYTIPPQSNEKKSTKKN